MTFQEDAIRETDYPEDVKTLAIKIAKKTTHKANTKSIRDSALYIASSLQNKKINQDQFEVSHNTIRKHYKKIWLDIGTEKLEQMNRRV